MVVTNLLEQGDEVICCISGVFGSRFVGTFTSYGVKVHTVSNPDVGYNPTPEQVEKALKEAGDKAKVITFTHVETSTAVRCNLSEMCKLVRKIAPNILIAVDAVAATGAEESRMEEWDIDYVMTGSQKALGVPPGLSIVIASERALNVYKNRKTRYPSYFSNWDNWLPIMKSFEDRKPAYFGTPASTLIVALNKAYDMILEVGLSEVWNRHKRVSNALGAACESIGLKQVTHPGHDAHSMSCIWLPEGFSAEEFLRRTEEKKVVFAPAIFPETRGKAFRFGHMGVSAWDLNRPDVLHSIIAMEESLAEMGYKFEKGKAATVYKEQIGKQSSNL